MSTSTKVTEKQRAKNQHPKWWRWRYMALSPVVIALGYIPWQEVGITFTIKR